jgi:hypothetical protein
LGQYSKQAVETSADGDFAEAWVTSFRQKLPFFRTPWTVDGRPTAGAGMVSREFAPTFRVSIQAMRMRLEPPGLLPIGHPRITGHVY